MKKSTILLLLLLLGFEIQAQVGINTTTPNAQLEIKSSNEATPANTDGLLIPKINAFPATNPTFAQRGMMVYLTSTVGSNSPGFYYWDSNSTSWLSIGQRTGWSLKGNNQTNPAVNFLGTTDNTPLIIKQNNFEVARLRDDKVFNIGLHNPVSFNYAPSGFDTAKLFINSDDSDNNIIFQSFNNANDPIVLYFGKGNGTNASPAIVSSSEELGRIAFTGFNGTGFISGANIRSFVDGTPSAGSMPSDIRFLTTPDGSNSLLQRMVIRSNGNVGVGVFNALDKLHIAGKIRIVDGSQALGNVLVSDANGTGTWTNPATFAGGTLDQAYDFGGAGLGRTITADAGAVTIDGTDGLVSTGTSGSGALAPSGAGVKMFWNPRKAAFRAGNIPGSEWDDINIGLNSVAFGFQTRAIGLTSTAFGQSNTASGSVSTAFGSNCTASGSFSVAFGATATASGIQSLSFGTGTQSTAFTAVSFGAGTTASGTSSTAFGNSTTASGNHATAFGSNNTSFSFGETVLGIGATTYTPSTNGATQFRAANATDRLFVIGNAIDSNSNSVVDTTERSDAMVVLKNGLTRLPSITNTMIDAADGKAVVTKEYLQSNHWSLEGNAGTNSTTNFIGTTDNIDLVFRRNNLISGRIGDSNTFYGSGSGVSSSGTSNTYIGVSSGNSNTTGSFNTFLGRLSGSSGSSGDANTYIGYATGLNNTGNNNCIIGAFSGQNTSGDLNVFIGNNSGSNNTTGSRNTVIGNNAEVSGSGFINATAIGHRAEVGASNAMVLGSINGVNGATSSVNVGIGTTIPLERLHVAGRSLFTSGFAADNAALLYRNDTDYMFIGPQSGSSTDGGAMALFGSTYTSSGNAGGVDFNVPGGQVRMNHTNGGYTFSASSTSGYTGSFEINDNGFEIGNNSASRALIFSPNSAERMRITPAGNVGIGTTLPAQKVHVSGPAGLTAVRIGNTSLTGSTSNVALDFFRSSAVNTDWRIYNIGANLTIGNSGDDLATVNDLYQFQGVRFMPMTDATINLGQGTNRWNTLFASNGTINTSDFREKKNINNIRYGLKEIMQLRPVSFEWKKDDGSGTKLGLIAQELQQVLPETVRDWDWETNEQGVRTKVKAPVMGVYYSDLIPVLIKAIQEQQKVIENQKTEIQLLKVQLEQQQNAILKRLEKLEAKN